MAATNTMNAKKEVGYYNFFFILIKLKKREGDLTDNVELPRQSGRRWITRPLSNPNARLGRPGKRRG